MAIRTCSKSINRSLFSAALQLAIFLMLIAVTVTSAIADDFYLDIDGDGFGDHTSPLVSFPGFTHAPGGFASAPGDCADTLATVHPFALEIVSDGIDNDCDGDIDLFDSSSVSAFINTLPIASFTVPTGLALGNALTVDGSASNDPDFSAHGDAVYLFHWDLNNGAQTFTTTVANPTFSATEYAAAFSGPGTYTVALEVTDRVGGKSSTALQLTVVPEPAAAHIGFAALALLSIGRRRSRLCGQP